MIAFSLPKGVFWCKVTSFNLKNVRAIYQNAMPVLFRKMLGNIVECYLDDLIMKFDLEYPKPVFHKLKNIN